MDYKKCAEETMHYIMNHPSKPRRKESDTFYKGEMKILGYLFFHKEEATPGELGEFMGVSSARVARALKSLEEKKIIQRTTLLQDRRKTVVSLTDIGKETFQKKHDESVEYMSRLFSKLGEHDTLECIRIIEKILRISSEIGNENLEKKEIDKKKG